MGINASKERYHVAKLIWSNAIYMGSLAEQINNNPNSEPVIFYSNIMKRCHNENDLPSPTN